MHQDVMPVEEDLTFFDEAFSFEIPCEGPRAYPERLGDCTTAAKWIGLKPCGHHRLLCGDCKEFYMNLMAHFAQLACTTCGSKDAGFIGFELIDRARH